MPRIKCTTHTATYYPPLTTIPSTYLSRQLYLPVSVTQKIGCFFWATYPKATLLWSTAFVVQQARRQTDVPPALPLLWLQHRHRFSHSQVFLAALKQDSSKKNLYSVLKQRGWHKPHFICTNTLYSCIFHSVLCVSCDKVVWHPSGER